MTVPIFLFDVDGTLISSAGAGRRSLERALEKVAAVDGVGALAAIRFDGMTDRAIVREAFRAMGRPFDPDECDRILVQYSGILDEELAAHPARVLPGVLSTLVALSASGAALGLGTGNIERGARAKLGRAGIDRYFAFGGFGDDGETREEILLAALRRACERVGRAIAPGEAIVVGDTPRDIDAARAVGCRSVGVASGRFDLAQLAGADHALRSLDDPAAPSVLLGCAAL